MALIINTPGAKAAVATPYDKHLAGTEGAGNSSLIGKQAKGTIKIIKTKNDKAGGNNAITAQDTEEIVHKGILLEAKKACVITVTGGSTVNLGNYEFARIDVALTMQVAEDELDAGYEFICTWVSEKIAKAVKDSKE